jgi:hypothetical protein
VSEMLLKEMEEENPYEVKAYYIIGIKIPGVTPCRCPPPPPPFVRLFTLLAPWLALWPCPQARLAVAMGARCRCLARCRHRARCRLSSVAVAVAIIAVEPLGSFTCLSHSRDGGRRRSMPACPAPPNPILNCALQFWHQRPLLLLSLSTLLLCCPRYQLLALLLAV